MDIAARGSPFRSGCVISPARVRKQPRRRRRVILLRAEVFSGSNIMKNFSLNGLFLGEVPR